MNNFFEKNIEFLKKKHRSLFEKVDSYLKSGAKIILRKDNQGKINIPIQTSPTHGVWLYPANREEDKQRIIRQILEIKNPMPQIIIWMGLGFGDYLLEYTKNPHPKNKNIIVIEPSMDIFCQCLTTSDCSILFQDHKYLWFIGEPEEEFSTFLDNLFVSKLLTGREFQNHIILKWADSYPDFDKIQKCCTDLMFRINYMTNTSPIDTYIGFLHFMKNLKKIPNIPELDRLKNLYQGKPGIMIATGPSLANAIPHLKKVASKAVVFAVDSALKLLEEHGITPHLTGSIERSALVNRLFQDCDTTQTVFCSTPICHPSLYESYSGPIVHYVRPHHFLPWIFPTLETHQLPMLSVAHTGIYILAYLGCSPIYLIGQDLAFDPYTQSTHAKDYSWNADKTSIKNSGFALTMAKANNGNMIETDELWYYYGLHISVLCQQLKLDCYNVIPMDYGLEIKNTQRIDYEEAVSRIISGDIIDTEIMKEQLHLSNIHKQERKKLISQTLEDSQKWLISYLRIALSISHKIFKAQSTNENLQLKIEDYEHLIKEMDQKLNAIGNHPAANMLGSINISRHMQYIYLNSEFALQQIETKEDIKERLSLLLAWNAEGIIRAQSVLRILEKELI